jgi:23S rRNA (uracil1939-C5)-methyltransferase
MKITIETLCDGMGVGSINGKPVHVPKTLPEEIIEIQEVRRKKKFSIALVKKIRKKNRFRKRAKCKHFPICQGCQLQHLKDDKQLQVKQRKIDSLFAPLKVFSITPCKNPFHYRNKVELTFTQTHESKTLGFMPLFGFQAFDLKNCLLFDPWIKDAKRIIQQWWDETGYMSYEMRSCKGSLRNVTLRTAKRSQDKMVILQINCNPKYAIKRKDLDHLYLSLTKIDSNIGFYIKLYQVHAKSPTQEFTWHYGGCGVLNETMQLDHRTLHFKIGPNTFFQPNLMMAEKMLSVMHHWLEPYKGGICLDLYCGIGSIGMSVCDLFDHVFGIEVNRESILDAKEAARQNTITNCTFLACDAKAFLMECKHSIDVIIVDPPRAGLGLKTIEHIKALNPKVILYLSCNPKTQLEDMQALNDQYFIEKIQPFDAFPNTYHIENLLLMKSCNEFTQKQL